MTPMDALNYIDSIVAQVPATREQHVRIQAAMNTLAQVVQPPAPKSQSQANETRAVSTEPRDS